MGLWSEIAAISVVDGLMIRNRPLKNARLGVAYLAAPTGATTAQDCEELLLVFSSSTCRYQYEGGHRMRLESSRVLSRHDQQQELEAQVVLGTQSGSPAGPHLDGRMPYCQNYRRSFPSKQRKRG